MYKSPNFSYIYPDFYEDWVFDNSEVKWFIFDSREEWSLVLGNFWIGFAIEKGDIRREVFFERRRDTIFERFLEFIFLGMFFMFFILIMNLAINKQQQKGHPQNLKKTVNHSMKLINVFFF